MSDFDRALSAMKMVVKHKMPNLGINDEDIELLAETAVKTMYLIDAENERKNAL
jgi:hypothetical protein